MSLAYKVEELLALRDSVSESAVSIDRFADEDVIKGQCPPFTLTVRFTSPACGRLISSPLSVVGTLLLLTQLYRTRPPSFRICVRQSSQQTFKQKPTASCRTAARIGCIAEETLAYPIHQARQS
jgi:hypothetical protein